MISFQKKVYKVVQKIPRGNFLTYKQVAERAGSPKAWRAVGNILNKNPDPKTIPCYRVIKSDRKTGGYRKGIKNKIALLRKEGLKIEKGKVVF
jgi:methylated-DNA-[protein]-cysteine S-methyltransferase